MNHYRSLATRGLRVDPVQKQLMQGPRVELQDSVSQDFPTTAILLMGFEFANPGLIGYADEVSHELTEAKVALWYLKAIMPRMRKLYTSKALAGHFS